MQVIEDGRPYKTSTEAPPCPSLDPRSRWRVCRHAGFTQSKFDSNVPLLVYRLLHGRRWQWLL